MGKLREELRAEHYFRTGYSQSLLRMHFIKRGLLPGSMRTRRRYTNSKPRKTLCIEMDLILTLATERPLYNSLIIDFSRWFDLSVNKTLLNPLVAKRFYN